MKADNIQKFNSVVRNYRTTVKQYIAFYYNQTLNHTFRIAQK